MALQLSTGIRNAMLDSIEATVGTTPLLRIYDGVMPADCAAAEAGTILSEVTLPSDWLDAAAGGAKAKAGTWSDLSADASGTALYFRLYDSGGSTCHMQGVVTLTGGGGQLTVNNTNFLTGQTFSVVTFVISAGNA